jgi:hypothetical protein
MKRIEQAIHRQIVAGLRAALPRRWVVAHIPNGGHRSDVEGAIFKAMGVLPGMPDIMILGETDEGSRAWFFEVKRDHKAPLTAHQKNVHETLRDLGFAVEVVTSWTEALRWANHWRWPLRIAA